MMTENQDEPSTTTVNIKYFVTSVEKTDAPEGLPGKNWHRYIITRGTSTIVGTKPGTLKNVTEHANNVAEDLNSRSGIQNTSTYASREVKKS